jgi:hypothetical protein
MLTGGPADGVVPVDSARHDRVDSEVLVPATHQHLQTHPDPGAVKKPETAEFRRDWY